MSTCKKVVSIGDIFIDFISDLSLQNEQDTIIKSILYSGNVYSPIHVHIGGAGLQFAVSAKRVGFDASYLIGKIGGMPYADRIKPDNYGSRAINYMNQNKVIPLLATDTSMGTGRIIVIYLPNNQRFMISDPLANGSFCPEDITPEMITAVKDADLIHVSGYTFLQPDRLAATLNLLRHAREGNAIIALDVVPHDISKHYSLPLLESHLYGLVDWGIIAVSTAYRFVQQQHLNKITSDVIDKVFDRLKDVFASMLLYVEPGFALVKEGDKRYEFRSNYEPGMTSRGQSAESQSIFLYNLLNAKRF